MLASSTWSSIRSKRIKISEQMSWRVKRKLTASNAKSMTTLLNWKLCYNTMRRLRSSNRPHLANSHHLQHTLPLRNHYAQSSISSTNSRTIRSLIKPQRAPIGRRSLSRVKTRPKWSYPIVFKTTHLSCPNLRYGNIAHDLPRSAGCTSGVCLNCFATEMDLSST